MCGWRLSAARMERKACEMSEWEGARARVACWRDGRDIIARRQAGIAVSRGAPGAEFQLPCACERGSARSQLKEENVRGEVVPEERLPPEAVGTCTRQG